MAKSQEQSLRRKRPLLRRRKKSNCMKTFTNTLGVWEIQEDGTIRLIREASEPVKRVVRKNAGSRKRNRIE